MKPIIKRFLKYVSFHTESEFEVEKIPSTDRQFEMAKYLEQELKDIGMQNVSLDENCYIMANLPSNIETKVPTIGFIAHIDTSPDFTGKNIKPQIWENYDGKDIVLNKDQNIILSSEYFTTLKNYKGQTIITTDGTTLLGADDKAGVTEIVTAMEYLINNPDIKHGEIKICFTPDEEVGRGADLFDVKKFGVEWAYTMDGSEVGELEYENFNAAFARISFYGKLIHPGYAIGKMVNAISYATSFSKLLPKDEVPEKTTGYEGFFHLYNFKGGVDKSTLEYIIRDHDKEKFEQRKQLMSDLVKSFNQENPVKVNLNIKDQYYNMKEKVAPHPHIIQYVKKAMEKVNITPNIKAIRGGTDGSKLSFMGLPCPNIFAGGHNFHGRFEYLPVESMEKAVQVIVNIAELVGTNKYKN